MKIKLNDTVSVISGKDKGKTGKVTRVYPKDAKVLVQGVNLYRKHLKKQSDKNPGGIVSLERPLPAANVMVICPKCRKPSRFGLKRETGQAVYRVCKRCHQPLLSQK